MSKKYFWLFAATIGVLFGNLGWAETKKVGPFLIQENHQQPLSTSASAKSSRFIQPAGPQDLCPNTSACFGGVLGGSCDVTFIDTGTVWSYQDPAKNCPPLNCFKVYPFQVKAIHVLLSNCEPIQSCLMVLTPAIHRVDFTDPVCPKPRDVVCSGPAVQIIIPPNTFCQEFVIPLDSSCCVDTTYFASLTFHFPNGPCGGICHDLTCDPCCDYGSSGSFLDFCQLGLPGNVAVWTDGILSCQNNCHPPPPAGQNHYKTWRIQTQTVNIPVTVSDQFISNRSLVLDRVHFLSNPVQKIIPGNPDTFNIVKPNNHLTWYKGSIGSHQQFNVEYVNQFESTAVLIEDSVPYLLVPTQKFPHPRYDSLDHYRAYNIIGSRRVIKKHLLEDQFDSSMGIIETIDSLEPLYFCAPASKNNEPRFDTLTHYTAYRIFPTRTTSISVGTEDQFGPRPMFVTNSEMLMVPTIKKRVGLCPCAKGDINCDGTFSPSDVVCLLNCVFLGAANPPCVCDLCVADVDCNGTLSPSDVVLELNRVYLGLADPPWCGL